MKMNAIENLIEAQKYAMSIRPKIGGFPYLAEALRLAGITRNIWSLPSCQSLYLTKRCKGYTAALKLLIKSLIKYIITSSIRSLRETFCVIPKKIYLYDVVKKTVH